MRTAGLAYLVATASTLGLLAVVVALQNVAAGLRRLVSRPAHSTRSTPGGYRVGRVTGRSATSG